MHFLQIWIQPDVRGIAPSYEQKRFGPEEKRGRLRLVASPDRAEGSVLIHQDARVYAGLFTGSQSAQRALAPGRLGYVQVARGAASVNGVQLSAGDGALLRDESQLTIDNGENAEVLLFDLPAD